MDDSLSARQTTADTLRDNGFRVITAVDGVDALKQLQHARPDMLVTDLEMPRMNGLELTALLKSQVNSKTSSAGLLYWALGFCGSGILMRWPCGSPLSTNCPPLSVGSTIRQKASSKVL
ncbi:MAG: response regulator [Methylovulum sp.]|uniref:response regulator n=1 Tax=Methylovulum sp. TaxID=1916980 RepID=UPI00262EA7C3|nr:response regulator [Methylovulum sp.]MDD2725562.1 response regulator [Methylovulum sp.]MDD5125368.1 response regulator [Methylovulum sp.]